MPIRRLEMNPCPRAGLQGCPRRTVIPSAAKATITPASIVDRAGQHITLATSRRSPLAMRITSSFEIGSAAIARSSIEIHSSFSAHPISTGFRSV
jgi:hypothetical protein